MTEWSDFCPSCLWGPFSVPGIYLRYWTPLQRADAQTGALIARRANRRLLAGTQTTPASGPGLLPSRIPTGREDPARPQQGRRPRLTTVPSPGAPGTRRSRWASLSVPRDPTYHGSDCPSPSLSQAPGVTVLQGATDPRTCRPTDVELPGSCSRDTRNQACACANSPKGGLCQTPPQFPR